MYVLIATSPYLTAEGKVCYLHHVGKTGFTSWSHLFREAMKLPEPDKALMDLVLHEFQIHKDYEYKFVPLQEAEDADRKRNPQQAEPG